MKEKYPYIVVLGAQESGVGAAILAALKRHTVWVSDYGTIPQHYQEELAKYNIAYEQNGHTTKKILSADLIIKSPGIPDKAPIVQQLKAAGKPIISEIEFGYWYKGDAKLVAITGSNGKSTTTTLIYHLFKQANYDVAIVGNIGTSFAKQVALDPKSWYIIEVSSFQLDDIIQFRADINILLNITPDHLDRYNYQFEKYIESKFRLITNSQEHDIFIYNQDDPAITKFLDKTNLKSKTITITMEDQVQKNEDGAMMSNDSIQINYDGENLSQSIHDLKLKGRHNIYNTMAAGISARAAGIRSQSIRESLETFDGLEHRLEFVATVRGVDFINDSKATNLNSVWFALESMTKRVILILGGQDKGNDYNEIMDLVKEKVKAIVCLGIDNTPIHNAFDGQVGSIVDTGSAKDAVHAAYALADKDDVVLLAPGCASFDLFKNYEDRGTQFKQAVREL